MEGVSIPSHPSLPSPIPLLFFSFPSPLLPLEVGPLKLAKGFAGAENEFGALYSCQEATGGNYLQYSELLKCMFYITWSEKIDSADALRGCCDPHHPSCIRHLFQVKHF